MMKLVNDDIRLSDELAFSVNGKTFTLSAEDREKLSETAEGVISLFAGDLEGEFAGIFVYQSVDDSDIDAFVFEDQNDKWWFLVLSSEAVRANAVSLKVILAEALLLSLEYGPEVSIDLARYSGKR